MKRKFTNREHYNAAIALAILLLAIYLFKRNIGLIYVAFGELILAAVYLRLIYPISFVWYNIALLLSKISTTVLLTLVYFVVVLPVGLLRKMFGKDNLKLSLFKKGKHSVLVSRDHKFCSEDLIYPY